MTRVIRVLVRVLHAQAASFVKRTIEADGIKLIALVNNAGVQSDMPVELQVRHRGVASTSPFSL